MNILPMIPSQLLRIAHADLEKVRLDPTLGVFMNVWINANLVDLFEDMDPAIKCEACLAGAVMLKTLDFDPFVSPDGYPEHFPDNTSQLHAIEDFRSNRVGVAFNRLRISDPFLPDCPRLPDYEPDPDAFMTALLALTDHFEAHGF